MGVTIRQRACANGTITVWLDIWDSGRRYYEKLGIRLPKEKEKRPEFLHLIEELRARREFELHCANHDYIPPSRKDQNFIDYFEKLAKTRHKTWGTVLRHLRAFTGNHLAFKRVTGPWFMEFQHYLLTQVHANAANVYLHKLKASLNIAVEQGVIKTNPCSTVRIVKSEPSERTFLTFEEVQQLANTPTPYPEIKRAFLFSCYTGLRLSDVKRLTASRIVGDQLQFRQKKTGGFEYLPLASSALQLLTPLPKRPDQPIFKLPKSDGALWTHLQEWVTMSGIEKHVSFHVARHTFATLALSNTKDLYMVSKLLGHKDIKHTQIYATIVDDRKREAVAMLPQLIL